MVETKNNKWLTFIKYTTFFVGFYILYKAKVYNTFNPFTFGTYFALVWCNQNILILSPLFVGASYLSNFNLYDVYSAIAICILMCIFYGLHYRFKKPINPTLMLVYSLVCVSCGVFWKLYAGEEMLVVTIELIFGLLYMFACMKIFESITLKTITRHLTLIQIVCGGFFVASLSCGIYSLNIQGVYLIKIFASMVVMFSTLILPILQSGILTLMVSLGTILFENNPYLMAPIIIWWVVVSCFRGRHKIFGALSLIVAEFMCVYYFNFYYTTSFVVILPCLITAIITILIPQKFFNKMAENYNASFTNRGLETLVNRNRNNIHTRLLKLSQVFGEMNNIFKSMIKKGASKEELKMLLVSELKSKTCSDCPEKNRCHRTYAEETQSIFNNLSNTAFENGKITLLDIPSVLTSRCARINQIVYETNDLISQYASYANMIDSIDSSKILISEQFNGVSNVLKELSYDIGKNVDFDNGLEQEIIDELVYNDISCCDAMVYHTKQDVLSCTLEVKKDDSLKSKISKIVSKICKTKMVVETDESSTHAGWQILNLKTAPKFDIIFGTSQITKSSSTKSGDCYSLVRMEDNKILMAICDGMGSGEKAQKASNTAVSLVENFYKAGFDSTTILSIVNKFLALGNQEVFSCLDMAIIDLKSGGIDFIKLGASSGYIKHKDTISEIKCNSLPLGILSTISPTIKTAILNCGEMVVLCSDGVSDSFASSEQMADFVNNIVSVNPQEVADKLMDRALENNKGIALDDMTILCCKIF